MSEDRYEIRDELGKGGAGSVYLAHDTRLERDVAMKRLDTESADSEEWSHESVENMLKEARMLSSITHPNIVTIYDADVDDKGPYVVMELLKGRNIDDLIAENTLTAGDFEEFAKQCLEGLIAAHTIGIIHRDIKPNNIVLKWLPSGQFQAKLLDFGMAKFSTAPSKQSVDQTDSVFGSIFFMAPEQFERTELDVRTDLYALGSVLYYTLAGVYPFSGETAADVMAAHLSHIVAPLSDYRDDIPEWVCTWVMWLINRDMEHRPQDAQEALDIFLQNTSKVPLKNTSAVSTKLNTNAEGHYFGQSGSTSVNQAAMQSYKSASAQAPVLISAAGTLIIPEGAKAQGSTHPTSTVAFSSPQLAEESGNIKPLPKAKEVKKKSNAGLFIILALVTLGVIVAGSVFATNMAKAKKIKELNAILLPAKENVKDIPTTAAELEILLSQLYTSVREENKELVYLRLAEATSSDTSDIDYRLAEFATQEGEGISGKIRQALFRVLKQRNSSEALPFLQDFITSYEGAEVVATAINTAKHLSTPEDLTFFLDIILTSDEPEQRKAAEAAAEHIIKGAKQRKTIARELKASLSEAKNPLTKASVTRLLGALGGKEAQSIIEEAITSGDKTQILPALSALKEWPDGSMTDSAIDFWLTASDPASKKSARDAVFSLMKRHHINSDNAALMWEKVSHGVSGSEEKMQLLNHLVRTNKKFAIPLVKTLTQEKDAALSKRAEVGLKRLAEKAQ